MKKYPVEHLLDIMSLLRDKKRGCPWDIKQTFETVAPYTIEEAYEVLDAIVKKDLQSLKDELGDLLLNVVFHSQIAKEEGLFSFEDVVKSSCEKMVRRHPHVFGSVDRNEWANSKGVWEEQKAQERDKKKKQESLLDDVALSLPALTRSVKLQKRASRVGFDWNDHKKVIDKIKEETQELIEATGKNKDAIEDEMGDLLFACSNLARKLEIDPEKALRRTNRKFENRFHFIETELKNNQKDIKKASLDYMEELWKKAKSIEKSQE